MRVGRDIFMTIELNHTIVAARDKLASAMFLTDLLGLPAPAPFGPFLVVTLTNGVSLDFMDSAEDIRPQHYASRSAKLSSRRGSTGSGPQELQYWADPYHQQPGEINTRDGGHGVYFDDPDGHVLELLTRPYGSGSPN